jgi:hypothetical protein
MEGHQSKRIMEEVELRCSCGTELLPGARFCHKCGKPQFELAVVEEGEQAEHAGVEDGGSVSAPALKRIDFRNSVAVRTSLLAAAMVCVLISVPMPALLAAAWQLVMLLAGGFSAVYLYVRRTGEPVTVGGGAKLGWFTGLFCFLIVMVFFTIGMLAVATGKGLEAFFRDLAGHQATPEIARQIDELLSSQWGLGVLLFGILATCFFMLTLLPVLGGALGAKVMEKQDK